ncbi:MAG: DUF4167 domain-containing protein [Pseudomonadota bacterium]
MIKRNRPRPNNGGMRPHRPHQNGYSSNPNLKNDDSSEVRLKNRGYYQQMYDKYSTAARESLSLGERIEAEGHFQHAEHYLRQLNDRIRYDNEAQQQQQQRFQAQQAQQHAQLLAQQNQQAAQAQQAQTQPDQSQQAQTQPAQPQPTQPQAPKPQHVHRRPTVKAAQPSVASDATEHNGATLEGDVNPDAPVQEKRPYRKRVLRTPHRRHTPQDGASQSATPSAAQSAPQNDSVTS